MHYLEVRFCGGLLGNVCRLICMALWDGRIRLYAGLKCVMRGGNMTLCLQWMCRWVFVVVRMYFVCVGLQWTC